MILGGQHLLPTTPPRHPPVMLSAALCLSMDAPAEPRNNQISWQKNVIVQL